MKLHDLKPAEGSRKPRKRVGRGIAAGQGKTAGRGTKGQKARAGGSIPPWFEGGQTPLHMRIPKLRGFKNRFKVDYEVVNVGRIGEIALLGAFESAEPPAGKGSAKAPVTVNQDILRAVGLVRTLTKPLKILGQGDIEVGLFIVADAFSKSAIAKIEGAGGSVQILEVPTAPLAAIGLEPTEDVAPKSKAKAKTSTEATPTAVDTDDDATPTEEPAPTAEATPTVDATPTAEATPTADEVTAKPKAAKTSATAAEITTKPVAKPKSAKPKSAKRQATESKGKAAPEATAEPSGIDSTDEPDGEAPAGDAPTDEDA